MTFSLAYTTGRESKFEKLREAVEAQDYSREKFLVFTEHKDTLEFLVRRFEALGLAGRIAFIHGGLAWPERREQIEFFRKPDGARIMICTDAAAEGVNLQFCWICVNYDLPWNPARLEQRMGRVHRYGQRHDPVLLLNMVSPDTREGKVLETLLEKLERIRQSLNSDKVFDCIGRVFSGVSIRSLMLEALLAGREGSAPAAIGARLEGVLTEEQIKAIEAQQASIYGRGGDVKAELPALKRRTEAERLRRLLPGYTHAWLENAEAALGLFHEGSLDGEFRLRAASGSRADLGEFRDAVRRQSGQDDPPLAMSRDAAGPGAVWIHPGESGFGALRALAWRELHGAALAGAVLVDWEASRPCILLAARLKAVRGTDGAEETLEEKIACVRHDGLTAEICPAGSFLVLGADRSVQHSPASRKLAGRAQEAMEECLGALRAEAGRMAEDIRARARESLPGRREEILRGAGYESSALMRRRTLLRKQSEAEGGHGPAAAELEAVQDLLDGAERKTKSLLALLDEEAEGAVAAEPEILGCALVLPGLVPGMDLDPEFQCPQTEAIAMRTAFAYEKARGASARDVHTPELSRAAGLGSHPGFDLLSVKDGERRCIEVKGTASADMSATVCLTGNEWAAAETLKDEYWIYAVGGCSQDEPELHAVQNPYERMDVRACLRAVRRIPVSMKTLAEQGE